MLEAEAGEGRAAREVRSSFGPGGWDGDGVWVDDAGNPLSVYAKNTTVSCEKSRAEIESTLARYGASAFAYATNAGRAMIQFQANDRRIMFVLNLPDRNDRSFTHGRRGQRWVDSYAYELWEKACRQRWRCLALAIKAKLESVESGISTFEEEFMAHIMLPNGSTVGQFMKPQIETAYQRNEMPALLPHFGGDK